MRKAPNPLLSKAAIQVVGDACLGALVVLVITLPFYIQLSGSKLSYTPEATFPTVGTNGVSSVESASAKLSSRGTNQFGKPLEQASAADNRK